MGGASDHRYRKRVIAGNGRGQAPVSSPLPLFSVGGGGSGGGGRWRFLGIGEGRGEGVAAHLRGSAFLSLAGWGRVWPGVGEAGGFQGDGPLEGGEERVLGRGVSAAPRRRLQLRRRERLGEAREAGGGVRIRGGAGGAGHGDGPDTGGVVLRVRATDGGGVTESREEGVRRSSQALIFTLGHRRPSCPASRLRGRAQGLMGRRVQARVLNVLWGGGVGRECRI